ncbi:MAG: hypothetical protein AAFW47_03545 [Pseudomonadota bacterium]
MALPSLIIGFIAGLSSLLLFAASVVGASLALPLLMLSPLPIAIGSLGWGTYAGFTAAAAGTVGLAFATSLTTGAFYAFAFAVPTAYLCHCVGLSRVSDDGQNEEWFPMGGVFLRAILYGAGLVGIGLIVAEFDPSRLSSTLSDELQNLPNAIEPDMEETVRRLIGVYVTLIPYTAPMVWLAIMCFNIWAAMKIVRASDRLRRPSTDFSGVDLPLLILGIFIAALIVSMAGPPLSFIGAAFVGSIAMALTLIGFITMHVITRKLQTRTILLATLYITTLLFSFPLLIMLGLGIADLGLKIRQRYIAANPS